MLEAELRDVLRERAAGGPPLPDPAGRIHRRAARIRRRRRRLVVAGSAAAVLLVLLGGLTAIRLARGDRGAPANPPATAPGAVDLLVGDQIRPAGGRPAIPVPAGVPADTSRGAKVPAGWLVEAHPPAGPLESNRIALIDTAGRLVWSLPGLVLQVAPGGRLATWLSADGHTLSAHDTATGRTVRTLALPYGGGVAGFWHDQVLVAHPAAAGRQNSLTLWNPATGGTVGGWGESVTVHAAGTSPDDRYPLVAQTVRTTDRTGGNTSPFRTCLVELDPATVTAHASFCLPGSLSPGGAALETADHRWLIWLHAGKGYRIDLRTALAAGTTPALAPACAAPVLDSRAAPIPESPTSYLQLQGPTKTGRSWSLLRCEFGGTHPVATRDGRLRATAASLVVPLAPPAG